MLLKNVLLSVLPASSAIASPILDRRQFSYGSTPVRGINIGGWLVLEPFITPSLFDPYKGAAIDEWTFCQNVPGAAGLLKNHWDTWATYGDFQKIAANGFNLVRIPIGYWALQKYPSDPFIQGAADYMEAAIGWARATGLKVWIDLHGAPLSQNGFDNSGKRMNVPQWTSTQDSITATENVIRLISQRWGTAAYQDVVVGIELLNEPLMSALPGGRAATQKFYQDGFSIARQSGQTPVIIHDGFVNPSAWNGVLTGQGANGAIVDHHEYQVFSSADNALTPQQHVDAVWSRVQSWGSGADKYVICGEWSAAMTDCATWLNGYGRGARYDAGYADTSYIGSCVGKSGDISTWSADWKAGTRNYIVAQRQAFEKYLQGWIVWNFKTENQADWSVLTLIDAGVWPRM